MERRFSEYDRGGRRRSLSRSRSRPRHPYRDADARRSRDRRGGGSRSRERRPRSRSFSRRRSRSAGRPTSHSYSRYHRRDHDHYYRRSRSYSADRYGGGRRRVSDRSRSRSRRHAPRRSPSFDRGRRSRSRDFYVRDRSWDRRHRQPSRSRDRGNGVPPARRRGRRGGRKERQRREWKEQQQQRAALSEKEQPSRNGSERSRSAEAVGDEKQQESPRVATEAPQESSDNRAVSPVTLDAAVDDATTQASKEQPPAPQEKQKRSASRSTGGRRNSAGRKGTRIPENWADVPKMGDVVRDSRFVPMRCPLDAKYTHLYASPDDAWSPEVFVQEQARRGYNVGMVIDLTNTFKYYDGSTAFGDSGIEYVKLKIEGFNAPPREQDVEQFTAIVDAFLAKADPSATIAVHCTHGLNRTGYLIAHYLVTKQRCSVTHALASFSLARPPGLIKHMYVEALYRLLSETEEVVLPVLPAWAAEKYGKRR